MSAQQQVALGSFCLTGSGTTPSRANAQEYYGGPFPWVKSGELREGAINATEETVTEAALRETSLKLIPAGALLVAMYGATVGRVGVLGVPATTNQAVCHVVPDPTRADNRYMFHALRSLAPYFISRGAGGAQPNISQGIVQAAPIFLPTLEEQRRIAAILDQTDILRRKRREALSAFESVRQSLFRSDFIDVDSDNWPLVEIRQLSDDMRTGPFGSQLLHSEFVEAGVAVLGIDNAVQNEFAWGERRYVTEQKYRSLTRYTVRPDDIIITIMGTCGRCAIVPDDVPLAINTKHLCCITLDQHRALPTFVHAAFLMHPGIRKQLGVQAKGAVMPGLNMGIIKSLKLRLPPLEIQREFHAKIGALKALEAGQRDHLAALDALFASLQHRAFRGEL